MPAPTTKTNEEMFAKQLKSKTWLTQMLKSFKVFAKSQEAIVEI
jgi:hypothetical protein